MSLPVVLDEQRARQLDSAGRIILRIPIGVGLAQRQMVARGEQQSLFDPAPTESGYEWPAGSGVFVTSQQLVAQCPIGQAGDCVDVNLLQGFSRSKPVGKARIAAVRVEPLELISETTIRAEGYENWTEYAFHWNQRYPGAPWDFDPVCWVAEICQSTPAS